VWSRSGRVAHRETRANLAFSPTDRGHDGDRESLRFCPDGWPGSIDSNAHDGGDVGAHCPPSVRGLRRGVYTHRRQRSCKHIASLSSHPAADCEENFFEIADQGRVAIHQDTQIGHHRRPSAGKEAADFCDLINLKARGCPASPLGSNHVGYGRPPGRFSDHLPQGHF